MTNITERAKELRIAEHTTPEDMGCRYVKVINYGDKVILSGYYYQGPNQPSYYGAVYEFEYEGHYTSEDFVNLKAISEEFFEDDGHAIEWAIKNA